MKDKKSFPWLDCPNRGWKVPCPACDKNITNEFYAFKTHWQNNPDCPGPETVDKQTWKQLEVKPRSVQSCKKSNKNTPSESTHVEISPELEIEGGRSGFPFIGTDRNRMRAECPGCNHRIENTLSSFFQHWATSESCTGPPESKPEGIDLSRAEWKQIVAHQSANTVTELINAETNNQELNPSSQKSNISDTRDSLQIVDGINKNTKEKLNKVGFETVSDVASTSIDKLTNVEGIGQRRAIKILSDVQEKESFSYASDDKPQFDEVTDSRETIVAERDVRQQATGTLDTAENSLDTARTALDDGSPRQALEHLDRVPATLDDARDLIDEYGFADFRERLGALNDRHDRLREETENALTTVPVSIPTAPQLSLSYDDIEKGRLLGRGGNADVYHTTAQADGETVELAVKEPRMGGGETLHTEVVEQMMTEAETWQQLADHDHIVGVVDYDAEPLPWIAMEYMDGGHLGERTDEMSFEQKLWTAIVTTKAVRHAHRRGVAHLDLKPENVLLREVKDAWDAPKVADWGLSKHLLEHSKSVEGVTPYYAAPEQYEPSYGSADDISDIYQLGAVFYELFTGRPPFEGRPMEVMNRATSEQPTPPSEIADLPPAIDDVLLTALATEKNERYDSVLYIRDALRDLSASP